MLGDIYVQHYNIQTEGEVDRVRVMVKGSAHKSLQLLCAALKPHLCDAAGKVKGHNT